MATNPTGCRPASEAALLEGDAGVGALVAILDDDRGREGDAVGGRELARDLPDAGHDDRSRRHDQRLVQSADDHVLGA